MLIQDNLNDLGPGGCLRGSTRESRQGQGETFRSKLAKQRGGLQGHIPDLGLRHVVAMAHRCLYDFLEVERPRQLNTLFVSSGRLKEQAKRRTRPAKGTSSGALGPPVCPEDWGPPRALGALPHPRTGSHVACPSSGFKVLLHSV